MVTLTVIYAVNVTLVSWGGPRVTFGVPARLCPATQPQPHLQSIV